MLSILLKWPMQFNWLILSNESVSKFPKCFITSLLYHFLQFSFTLIPPNILLKTFLAKVTHWYNPPFLDFVSHLNIKKKTMFWKLALLLSTDKGAPNLFWFFVLCLWSKQSEFKVFHGFNLWSVPGCIFLVFWLFLIFL